jgi:hypothetical protein
MGNSASTAAANAVQSLHSAIAAWDLDATRAALEAGADPAAFRVVQAPEKFIIWGSRSKPANAEVYALNGMGKLLSEAYLRLEAADARVSALPYTADQLGEFVRLLLGRGVDANAVIEKHGVAGGPLSEGSVTASEALRMTLETARDDRLLKTRRSLLVYPAFRALVEAAPAPGLTTLTTEDVLSWASVSHADAMRLILNRYGPVAVLDRSGARTSTRVHPLLGAIDAAAPATCVRALLEAGADANAADAGGATALMHCTGEWDSRPEEEAHQRPVVAHVEALLAAGADVRAADGRGRTALHHFTASPAPALDAALRRLVAVRLLSAGADADARDADGLTPMGAAAARHDDHLVKTMRRELTWMRRAELVKLHARVAGWSSLRSPPRPGAPGGGGGGAAAASAGRR